MNGKVFLVGAGPGDPELLTIKALKALQSADVVLYDDLIGPDVLGLIPQNVQVRSVGKRCGRQSIRQTEINTLLIAYASFGLKVVRLKGGDPLIFGRAGEEITALHKANIDFEIVPGVTSALASGAAAQVSLTHRGTASALTFLTSHQAADRPPLDWRPLVASGATLAIYMPGSNYQQTSRRLMAAGLRPDTPCALVSRASSKGEQVHRTTVRDLPAAPLLPAPTMLLVGDAIGLAAQATECVDSIWNRDMTMPPAVDGLVDNPGLQID